MKEYPNKKQCYGNFCTLENPDCERCKIDDALDLLELRNSVQVSISAKINGNLITKKATTKRGHNAGNG